MDEGGRHTDNLPPIDPPAFERERSSLSWRSPSFFTWAAGASPEYLQRCPDTEHIKYANIGALILLTAVCAFVSMFFAVSLTWDISEHTDQFIYCAPIALVWSFFIFSIDRYFISSMRPTHSPLARFGQALPRLILGVIIGIVISRPIELKIFESEISAFLADKEISFKAKKLKEEQNNLSQAFINHAMQDIPGWEEKNNRIISLKQGIETLQSALTSSQDSYLRAQKESIEEFEGSAPSKKPGAGPIYMKKVAVSQERKVEYDQRKAKYDAAVNELGTLERDLQNAGEKIGRPTVNKGPSIEKITLIGFATKNYALYQLSSVATYLNQGLGDQSKNSNVITWIVIAITALFVVIEIAPVLMKLLTPYGPYDDLLFAERFRYQLVNTKALQAAVDNTDFLHGEHRSFYRHAVTKIFSHLKGRFDNIDTSTASEAVRLFADEFSKRINEFLNSLQNCYAIHPKRPGGHFHPSSTIPPGLEDDPPPSMGGSRLSDRVFEAIAIGIAVFVMFIGTVWSFLQGGASMIDACQAAVAICGGALAVMKYCMSRLKAAVI